MNRIPKRLKEIKSWANWQVYFDSTNNPFRGDISESKIKKRLPPLSSTSLSYDEAFEIIPTINSLCGIALVITKKDDLVIVTMDNCFYEKDGRSLVHQPIIDILKQIKSYAEYNHSGTGLNIIAQITGQKKPENNWYFRGEFDIKLNTHKWIPVTGMVFQDYDFINSMNWVELHQIIENVIQK